MNCLLSALVIFESFGVGPNGVLAQDDPNAIQVRELDTFALANQFPAQSIVFCFDPRGNLKPQFLQSIVNDPLIQFLQDPQVRDEFELTYEQIRGLDRLIKDLHELNDAALENAGVDPKLSGELKSKFAQGESDAIGKLNDVLLPHQLSRLHEIHVRCLIRIHGLVPFLAQGDVREFISIRNGDISAVKTSHSALKAQVHEMARKAKDEAVDILLRPLSPSEQEAVRSRWDLLLSQDNVCISQLLLFLSPEYSFRPSTHDGPIEVFLKLPAFKLGVTGNLMEYTEVQEKGSEFDVFAIAWQDESFRTVFELSDYQIDNVNDCIDDAYARIRQLHFGNGELSNATSVNGTTLSDYVSMESASITNAALKNLKRIIGDNKWAQFEKSISVLNFRCAGPLFDILHGDLRQTLKLSDDKRASLEKAATAAREHLFSESNRIESFVLEKELSKLPANCRDALLRSMGAPLTKSSANIELLLFQLSF